MSTNEEKRVLLIKPGDILLLGNLGEFSQSEMDLIAKALNPFGIHGITFSHDIDIDKMRVSDLKSLVEKLNAEEEGDSDDDDE